MPDESSPGPGRLAHAGRPVAEAVDVSKRFGATVALAGVDLSVRAGESHALVGRNGAGKSTLVSLLTGMQRPDTGHVLFDGEPAPAIADREEWRLRVACVYQKSTILTALSVAENLFLNSQPRGRRHLISWGAMRRRARQLLEDWEIDVDERQTAASLTVEQRQLVEIARALSRGARFIVLDEPTAQLDADAIDRLFERIRGLQRQGVTLLYISHHLEEIYEICQTVTVLRDARRIVTSPVADLPRDALVAAMTGEAVGLAQPPATPKAPSDETVRPVLRVVGLGRPGEFDAVSFELRPGEAVGLGGAGGSGRVSLCETVVGLRRPATGTIEVEGKPLRAGSVTATLKAGIGYVPQDRHQQGMVPNLSVAENVTLTITDQLGPAGFIAPSRQVAVAARLIDQLGIRTTGPGQPMSGLSGGNQQKVVMGRALARSPRVLILVDPTAGVDVKSKEALLEVVEGVRREGTAVLIASDELDDLRPCDRVLVLFHGQVIAELARGWGDNELVAAMEGVDVTDD
jgi:simple sugar transport system ATP-binding protein